MKKIFSLEENLYHIDNVYEVKINPDFISVLKQSRSSMSESGIEELISSMFIDGQKTSGDIYAFIASEAENYVKEMNDLWNTNYKIESFNNFYIEEKKDYFYLFLVAGHRRLKACKALNFDYVAKIHFNKTFEEAVEWQLSENIQREELSLLDLITTATAYWVKMKKKNPKLTMTAFARNHIHKSVGWMNNALRFSRLPISLQELIKNSKEKKGVNYRIMLEFSKLYDFSVERNNPFNEKILLAYVNHCLSHKYSLKDVKKFCEDKKFDVIGQQSLFVLTAEEVNKQSIRKIREEKTKAVSLAVGYLDFSLATIDQLTKDCKDKSGLVIQKGAELDKLFSSE